MDRPESLIKAINILRSFEDSVELRNCYRDTMLALLGIGIIISIVGGLSTYLMLMVMGFSNSEFMGILAGCILLAIGFAIGDELGLRSSNCRVMLKKWHNTVRTLITLTSDAFNKYSIDVNLGKMEEVLLGKKLPKRIKISILVLRQVFEEILMPLYSILEKAENMDIEDTKRKCIASEVVACIRSFEHFDEIYQSMTNKTSALKESI
ncbi:MAG: hypothetical protein Q6363_002655, partial [Candidatus Njordarchaeota archaeon]